MSLPTPVRSGPRRSASDRDQSTASYRSGGTALPDGGGAHAVATRRPGRRDSSGVWLLVGAGSVATGLALAMRWATGW